MSQTAKEQMGPRSESLSERHGWKVLLAISAIVTFFGVDDLRQGGATLGSGEAVLMQGVTGTTWQELQAAQPRVANLIEFNVRSNAASMLALGLLSIAVCLTGLRRGERWAWYAMWVWPLWIALAGTLTYTAPKVPGAGTPVPVISGSILFPIAVLTLVLSYRKYFPKQPVTSPKEG